MLADAEHFGAALLAEVQRRPHFDLLVPLPNQAAFDRQYRAIPEGEFTRRWAGYATARRPAQFKGRHDGAYWQFVERNGERAEAWRFRAFGCTRNRDEVEALTEHYPKRWHVEEFFNAHQALG